MSNIIINSNNIIFNGNLTLDAQITASAGVLTLTSEGSVDVVLAGVETPSSDNEAANISYVDTEAATLQSQIDTNTANISQLQVKPWARIVLSSRVTCNTSTITTINTLNSGGDSRFSGISLDGTTLIQLPKVPNRRYRVTFQIWITEANATSNSFLQVRGFTNTTPGSNLVRKVVVRLPGGNEPVSQACEFMIDSDDLSGSLPDYRFFFRFENTGADACIVEDDESIILINQI